MYGPLKIAHRKYKGAGAQCGASPELTIKLGFISWSFQLFAFGERVKKVELFPLCSLLKLTLLS